MLFNSYIFLLGFLPVALVVFHGLRALKLDRAAMAALVLLSLGFYGWWDWRYLFLLVPLLVANFLLGRALPPLAGRWSGKLVLALGIAMNLGVLIWFKYANFVVHELDARLGMHLQLAHIVLPLGISFFIFQKIAYLVDSWRGETRGYDFIDYCLFVSFFPQLIAGPIVHHKEVVPQFAKRAAVSEATVALGVAILAIGLAKKVLLADNVAGFASARFDAVAAGQSLGMLDAWTAALAYTMQLYLDFSGYSDMAIGLALLFGIRLPMNFASPYKAGNIIEFWRRWHMTLSRFLRDYLYIPLGGSRHGPLRRYLNLFITMLLGGIWHGAGWTFVIWGALHGSYLIVNHAWRALAGRFGLSLERHIAGRAAAWAITLAAVIVGWVFFRAPTADSALRILAAMAGVHASAPAAAFADSGQALAIACSLLVFARVMPNTQELTGYTGPGETVEETAPAAWRFPRWRPSPAWAVATGVVLAVTLISLSKISEFLYFQF